MKATKRHLSISMGRVSYGPNLLWAEIVMGRICYGPRCPGTEEGYHLTPSKIFKDCKECVRIKAVP